MKEENLIKDYLLGNLSDEETITFRKEMENNKELVERVKLVKNILLIDELEKQENIRSMLSNDIHQKYGNSNIFSTINYVQIGVALILFAIIVSGVIYFGNHQETPSGIIPSGPNGSPPIQTSPDTLIKAPMANRLKQPVFQRLELNTNDLDWMNKQNERKGEFGFGSTDSLAMLANFIHNKKYKDAIRIGCQMSNKSPDANLNLAFAYYAIGQDKDALVILEMMIADGVNFYRTDNATKLLAAKIYYNSGQLDKCKILIGQIKTAKEKDSSEQFMGSAFWAEFRKMLAITKLN